MLRVIPSKIRHGLYLQVIYSSGGEENYPDEIGTVYNWVMNYVVYRITGQINITGKHGIVRKSHSSIFRLERWPVRATSYKCHTKSKDIFQIVRFFSLFLSVTETRAYQIWDHGFSKLLELSKEKNIPEIFVFGLQLLGRAPSRDWAGWKGWL